MCRLRSLTEAVLYAVPTNTFGCLFQGVGSLWSDASLPSLVKTSTLTGSSVATMFDRRAEIESLREMDVGHDLKHLCLF